MPEPSIPTRTRRSDVEETPRKRVHIESLQHDGNCDTPRVRIESLRHSNDNSDGTATRTRRRSNGEETPRKRVRTESLRHNNDNSDGTTTRTRRRSDVEETPRKRVRIESL